MTSFIATALSLWIFYNAARYKIRIIPSQTLIVWLHIKAACECTTCLWLCRRQLSWVQTNNIIKVWQWYCSDMSWYTQHWNLSLSVRWGTFHFEESVLVHSARYGIWTHLGAWCCRNCVSLCLRGWTSVCHWYVGKNITHHFLQDDFLRVTQQQLI